MAAKRAARYLRQSKSDADGIERQDDRTAALVRARGWVDAGIYIDDDITASKPRGPSTGWGRLLADAKSGRLDVVVSVDMDRLLRSTRDLNTLIDHGLPAVTVDGEIDLTTADGEFRATMLAGIARFEVRRKGERQTRALRQRAERGGLPSGVRLTGYSDQGALIKSEARLVKEMFERFLAGDSLRSIAVDFEERGITTRSGRSWNPSSVRTCLINPRYAGLSAYKGEVVTKNGERVLGNWSPIVTEATYDAVRARLADPARKTSRHGTDRRHLGSGLFFCGECGLRMRSHNTRYRCPDAHLMRSRMQVDDFVLRAVRRRLGRADLRDLLTPASDERAAALSAEIEDQRRRLAAIEHDYDEGLIDGPRYAEASRKTRERLESAQAQRTAITAGSAASPVLNARDPVVAFDAATLGAQRTIIDALMSVRLLSAPRGRKTFDPETVGIDWKH